MGSIGVIECDVDNRVKIETGTGGSLQGGLAAAGKGKYGKTNTENDYEGMKKMPIHRGNSPYPIIESIIAMKKISWYGISSSISYFT